MSGRTNTMTSVASKASISTSKRIDGGNKPRLNSGGTRTSSGATSIIIGLHRQESNQPRPVKLITEVDRIYFKKRIKN